MGLDQYVFLLEKSEENKDVDIEYPEEVFLDNFFYWRKHANLEGFISSASAERSLLKQTTCENYIIQKGEKVKVLTTIQ